MFSPSRKSRAKIFSHPQLDPLVVFGSFDFLAQLSDDQCDDSILPFLLPLHQRKLRAYLMNHRWRSIDFCERWCTSWAAFGSTVAFDLE